MNVDSCRKASVADPRNFVTDQDMNKKLPFYLSFLAYYFLKEHLHHFSKIKSHKEITKKKKSMFFLLFLLDDPGFGAASISMTHGSGSGSPENI